MMGSRRRELVVPEAPGIELNVMPFIDIFSLLCTFLLFSVSFIAIGIHEIQIPFLSNAAPPTQAKSQQEEKTYEVRIQLEMAMVQVSYRVSGSQAQMNTRTFARDDSGLQQMATLLAELKADAPASDKVELFVNDAVVYDDLVRALDHIKLRSVAAEQSESDVAAEETALFSKVVFGSVIL